jgi:hypothetical protein
VRNRLNIKEKITGPYRKCSNYWPSNNRTENEPISPYNATEDGFVLANKEIQLISAGGDGQPERDPKPL